MKTQTNQNVIAFDSIKLSKNKNYLIVKIGKNSILIHKNYLAKILEGS
jgi:hypothetical protein